MPIETKTLIADVYLELAKKKGPDKVSVKDISEACGISRQAFYYHFQDVPDLIQWAFEKKLNETAAQAIQIDDLHQALVHLIDSFLENTAFIKKLLTSQHYEQLHKVLFDDLQLYITHLIKYKRPDLAIDPQEMETALVFFTSGLTGVLLNYVDSKDVDSQQLADRLLSIFNADKNRAQ